MYRNKRLEFDKKKKTGVGIATGYSSTVYKI